MRRGGRLLGSQPPDAPGTLVWAYQVSTHHTKCNPSCGGGWQSCVTPPAPACAQDDRPGAVYPWSSQLSRWGNTWRGVAEVRLPLSTTPLHTPTTHGVNPLVYPTRRLVNTPGGQRQGLVSDHPATPIISRAGAVHGVPATPPTLLGQPCDDGGEAPLRE